MMTRRGGFTLIEVLIGMVIAAIIGAGLTNLMLNQTRYFAKQANARDARSVTRGAVNVLTTDLQNVEVGGGVSSATATQLVVRIPYAWGVTCSSGTAALFPVDSFTYASAVFAGYGWKDTSTAGGYTYEAGGTLGSGTASHCTGLTPAITAPANGRYVGLPSTPSTAAGSPVFLYQTVTYEFKASTLLSGRTALWRTVTGGAADEIVTPFNSGARFRFYSLLNDTPQDAVPSPVTNIRGIQLNLVAQSPRSNSNTGNPESVTINTAIFFRNRVN